MIPTLPGGVNLPGFESLTGGGAFHGSSAAAGGTAQVGDQALNFGAYAPSPAVSLGRQVLLVAGILGAVYLVSR
jgi:hypothetical protein